MIVFNFNALAQPGDDIVKRSPNNDGLRLWKMLYEATLGRMAVVINEDVETEKLEHWMKLYDVRAAWYDSLRTDDPIVKIEKIELIMNSFGRNDWYIDVDPATCSQALSKGITALLLATPYVIRPEWVNTPAVESWDTLVENMKNQMVAKTERKWQRGEE